MKKTWWKEAVMYQIYPRSFNDSNADGIGDLPGIIEKVDYLSELGVDIIWLGPVYESPNDDNGYDISNYREIHPEFGTMEDLEHLLDLTHRKGMRLIMDLVVNHTSDEHHWFEEAKKSVDNQYRDYYLWIDEPNNYLSYFGGSAWEYSPETEQYYLHYFTKKQPDLNWENPKVREEVYDIMKFWLDKGIDGFRMDVISLISKQPGFPPGRNQDINTLIVENYANGPKIHAYLQEMHREVLQHYDVMTVGEGPGITKEHVLDYVGDERKELNMIFQLELMFLDFGPGGKFDFHPFTIKEMKQVFYEWDSVVERKGWNNTFLDNHDFPRMLSRFGNDQEYRIVSAKLLAMFLLTFRGTPCIYQGSEFGMTNVAFDSIEDYDDVETRNMYKQFVEDGEAESEAFMKIVHRQSRDNARTPMQWSSEKNGGFTKGKPWIKMNPRYREINLEADKDKIGSIFNFYKDLISWRKGRDELIYADVEDFDLEHEYIFSYKRGPYYILLNFSDDMTTYKLANNHGDMKFLIGNYPKFELGETEIELRPWEGVILKK